MKKAALFLIINIISIYTAIGQHELKVDNITDSLKKNANAVFRYYNTSYKRVSLEKYTIDVHYAITILNPKGNYASELYVFYDRNSRVSDISGKLYNKEGVLQGKLNKKDIKDYATNNNYTLFSDNRVKYFKPVVTAYPYTIEFKYTIENTGVVGFDTWMPQKWFNISVESAELSFCVSKDLDINHLELNYDFNKKTSLSGDLKIYSWSVNNLKSIDYEPQAPNYLDFIPTVLLSPYEIDYEGTSGNFSTWNSYGKWVYNLIDGRDELPEETTRNIKNLTDTLSNKIEKIKAIYQYMQGKTRYVNIALGIGGFQPVRAMDVDSKGYGDCKALSNYTKALLKCVDINSYYTEIGTGNYQEIKFTEFASANQTNHIILCVPLETDTIWLECTNQKIPFGFLSPGSQNRYALLITPKGGELVKTPSFNANENTRISNIKIEINAMGDVDFEIITEYSNCLYTEIFSLIQDSENEQKEQLLKNLTSTKNIEIESFSLEDKSKGNPKGKLYVKGQLHNFTSKTSSRMFFAADFFHNNNFPDFIPDKRILDIFEPISYSYIDTLRISLPEGYFLESIQNNMQIKSVYGQCSYEVNQYKETIIIIRKLSINEGQYNNTRFGEINEFLSKISDFENKKMIISNKK